MISNPFGTYYEIYNCESGFLIYGELELILLDKQFNEQWRYCTQDILFGENCLQMNEKYISFIDFEGNSHEVDWSYSNATIEEGVITPHLEEYLHNYILENSTINSYPNAYVKDLKAITKYNDEYTLEYYNQMFSQYGMDTYQNVWDTRDGIDNEIDYEHELTDRAKEMAAQALIYQAIYEKAGLSVDMDAVTAEMAESYGEEYVTSMKESYGQGYMIQAKIQEVVLDYLVENANVQ